MNFQEGIPSLKDFNAWLGPQGGGVLVLDELDG